jgi:hypothetical protein
MIDEGGALDPLNVGDLMAFWVETPAAPFHIGLGTALIGDRLVEAGGAHSLPPAGSVCRTDPRRVERGA